MLKVIAYTGGHNAPSGVFRVQQYIQPLRALGVNMSECPSRAGLYPPDNKWKRPLWGVCNLCERLPDVIRSYHYDVSFFQRELMSTLVTSEPLSKRPRVFDIDDAIWVHRGGGVARRLASLCDHVICGNRFLAEEFSRWNPSVSILPTAVDVHVFTPSAAQLDWRRPIIGWMGLSSGLSYVYGIERSLARVLRAHPQVILRIVSGQRPAFRDLPEDQVEYVRWTPENEVRLIQEMTIGIMPLDDTVVSRGKCSFKMLLYMACAKPVVVSPVGFNAEVLKAGLVGFGAVSEIDWIDRLTELILNPDRAAEMGRRGREVVVNRYSVDTLAPQLADTLLRVSGR